jgi:hypothetical protein
MRIWDWLTGRREIRYLGDLQRLRIEPGDVYVLTVDHPVSMATAEHIQQAWCQAFGERAPKLLVLNPGMDLTAASPPLDAPSQEGTQGPRGARHAP